jgi:hypothetical protein
MIGAVCSGHPTMLHELGTNLGIEDLFDLVEILVIDAHNRRESEKMSREP